MDNKKKNFVLHILRRASFKWKPRNEALKASKIGRNQYLCAVCDRSKVYGNKDKQLDHVVPVQNLSGWDGFDNVIDRMFPEKEGWQVLCIPHHNEKTAAEKKKAAFYRQLKKELSSPEVKKAKKRKRK